MRGATAMAAWRVAPEARAREGGALTRVPTLAVLPFLPRLAFLPRLRRLALLPFLALLPLLAGCAHPVVAAEETLGSKPARWTLVVPAGATHLPEVEALLEARRGRFEVDVIEYDRQSGTPETRLAHVREQLERRSSAHTDPAGGPVRQHLLLVGSPALLSMGPWNFEGVAEPIWTDWMLGAGIAPTDDRVARADWSAALERPPLRTVGRLPLDDDAAIAAAARATLRHDAESTATTGRALFGAAGTGAAWPMATARNRLRDAGWQATLSGSGGSCDSTPAAFVEQWNAGAQLVCAAGMIGEVGGPGASAPILIAFRSSFARPDGVVCPALLTLGSAAAIASFTADVDAVPTAPALGAMSAVPQRLAAGVPLGLVVEGIRREYWSQSGHDIGAGLGGADRVRTRAALSAVLYGDPALQAAGTPSAGRKSEGLPTEPPPLVVPPPMAGTPALPAGPAPEDPSAWAWPVTIAALAALLALAIAVAARRTPG